MKCDNYLSVIIDSLRIFYQNDYQLLDSITNEMTITFRIAKYISEILENDEYKIDCEYHGMIKNNMPVRKQYKSGTGSIRRIRPDIIFHKRSTQDYEGENVFLIEVKKGSANGDIKKVQNAMKSLAYKKGYCITNIGKNYVTLIEFYKNDKYKKRRYKIVKQESNISLEELNNGKIKNGNS
jgi:hypothetical protein